MTALRIAAYGVAASLALALAFPALAADRHVTLVNGTKETMKSFQASNTGTKSWEEDILGQDTLAPGETIDINMDDGSGACHFDFLATFDDGTTGEQDNVDVCKVGKFTFTE